MAFTKKQVTQLNNMNSAAQKVQLGTLLSGGSPIPAAGSVSGLAVTSYKSAPTLASTTGIHAAVTCPTTGTTLVTTGITNPTTPRLLTVTGNQATVTGNVIIIGTDFADAALTDTIASSGTSTVASTKAFKTVTSIEIPTRGAASDTIAVGTSAKVGFPIAIPQTTRVLVKNFDGATDGGTITAGATAALSVYAASGTFDGTKVLELVFIN